MGFYCGLKALLVRKPRRHHGGSQLADINLLPCQPHLPNLTYKKLKGRSSGIIFIAGSISNMNDVEALAVEEFCKALGRAYTRGSTCILMCPHMCLEGYCKRYSEVELPDCSPREGKEGSAGAFLPSFSGSAFDDPWIEEI